MPNIDLRTLVLIVGVMGLLMSGIIFFLRRSLPSSIEGLREWSAAPAIILISMVLLAARGAIPDFISILCGNLLLLAGCVLYHIGAQRFFHVEKKTPMRTWLIGLVLSALAIAWCGLIEPDYSLRLRTMGTLMFGIFFSLTLLLRKYGGTNFAGRFVTAVLFTQSLVILLRFLATFVWPSGNGLFEPFIYQTIYIASFAFTLLLLTIGTVLLANERMRVEFEEIIGARRRSEEALRESEERWKFAIEGSGAGVWDWNLQTGDATYSKRWKEMLGWAEGEIGNSSEEWVKRVCPEDLPGVMANIQEHLDQKTAAAAVEYRMLTKEGGWKWIFGRGTVVSRDAAGKPLRLVGTNTDITERKQAEADRARFEAQLRESQKMEALGTMAGGVAHDFNNALTMITGNAELARQDVGSGHPALVSLEEIDKASRRAKDLVQQILSFGRRQKLERKATSLALVVVETARLIRATLPATVSLSVDCEPDAPAVLADATQIKQILLNLCGNAVQAIQDQGSPGKVEIDLRAHVQSEALASSLLKEGRYACLTVRDTGPGMDDATRSHIFEPFFTTKPVGKGTGLGLAVVHGIVQAHEATVEVESAPGEGSVFRTYFPAISVQAGEIAPSGAGAVHIDGAGKRVLYVDDEEAIVFLMQRLLERQGFRVSGYTDPREAVEAVRANPNDFDLAVTDFSMPGMNGLVVACALREIRPDLPVVLASGYITEELRKNAPAAGIRELIYKPNTVDDLCEAVARYANAHTQNAQTQNVQIQNAQTLAST